MFDWNFPFYLSKRNVYYVTEGHCIDQSEIN